MKKILLSLLFFMLTTPAIAACISSSDAFMWANYNPNLFIQASTNGKLSKSTIGQTINVSVYEASSVTPFLVTSIQTSSPYLFVTQTQNEHGLYVASLSATRPGVYVLQANTTLGESKPFVLSILPCVFPSSSTSPSLNQQTSVLKAYPSGVAPYVNNGRSKTVTLAGYTMKSAVTSTRWIPVQGKTPLDAKAVTILITPDYGNLPHFWTYRIPATNGHFAANLYSPYEGKVNVFLYPHYEQLETQNAETRKFGFGLLANSVIVQSQNTATTQQLALLASSQRDYNLTPQLTQIAQYIQSNAPSQAASIQGIVHYVASYLTYNQEETIPNQSGEDTNYLVQSMDQSYQSGKGVCVDFANETAGMLASIGIPARTVRGSTSNDLTPLSHEWIQVWQANHWVNYDPTWDVSGVSISGEYDGNSAVFTTTHNADLNQMGSAQ
jgi:hypothetical protein